MSKKLNDAALEKGSTVAIRKAEAEAKRLTELEDRIEGGLQTFLDVGGALVEIRESKLYMPEYKTFEAYCKKRWGMSVRHAYRLMDAAAVAENVSNWSQIQPASESQVRPMTGLEPDAQREVWDRATEAAGGQPTAQQVEAALIENLEKLVEVGAVSEKEAEKRRGRKRKPVRSEPDQVSEVLKLFRSAKASIRQFPADVSTEIVDQLIKVLDGVRGAIYALREPDKSGPMTDDSLFPFGKYKGTPMRKVKDGYLQWWKDKNPDHEVIEAKTGSYDYKERAMARRDLKLWDYIQDRFSR
jgi:hypothetical protein